jgi:taurine dioxygenase
MIRRIDAKNISVAALVTWLFVLFRACTVHCVTTVNWDAMMTESMSRPIMRSPNEAFSIGTNDNNDRFVVEVTGLDLSHQHDYATLELLKQMVMNYGVLVIRNQSVDLPVSIYRSVGMFFGQLQVHRENYSWHPDFNDVNYVSNIKDANGRPTGLNGGDVEQFHADLAWSLTPTTYTTLLGLVLPTEHGQGRTLFANTVAAFESLDPATQQQILGLKGVYSYWKHHPQENNSSNTSTLVNDAVIHPLVYTHPVTGKHSIYASAADTTRVVGMEEQESDQLLDLLIQRVAEERFRYEHDWKVGDMLIWDNRSKLFGKFCAKSISQSYWHLFVVVTQHKSGGCPAEVPRRMVRLTIAEPIIGSKDF